MGIVIVIVVGVAVAALLFGYTAASDARSARVAWPAFGATAGLEIEPLRQSAILAERLRMVRWRSAMRVGINPGRLLLDDTGTHWSPSWLTGRKVPMFIVRWNEITSHAIEPGPKLLGRRVAQLTFALVDGTQLRFATFDPDGLAAAIARLRPSE